MAFQVCTKDDYGQTSNVFGGKFDQLEDAIKMAKGAVTNDNINNALALDEKKRSWSSCFIEIFDEDGKSDPNAVYAGKGVAARDMICLASKGSVEVVNMKGTDAKVRAFIGTVNNAGKEENWYAQDSRGNEIDTPNHRDLADKMIYYIRHMG